MADGIYFNVSRRNTDIPTLLDTYSDKLNLSKADTFALMVRDHDKASKIVRREESMKDAKRPNFVGNKVLTEDEYNLVVWCIEQMWLDFDPQSEQDGHNAIAKLKQVTEFVPVNELPHKHQKRDLDAL